MQNAGYLIPNCVYLIQNGVYFIPNDLYLIQSGVYLIQNGRPDNVDKKFCTYEQHPGNQLKEG